MKDSALQHWYHVISTANACAIVLVLIVIVWKRLFRQKSFLALSLDYLLTFLHSLFILGTLQVSTGFMHYFGMIKNSFHIPLMLFFLTYLIRAAAISKTITKIILLFILFEIIAVISFGPGKKAETFYVGPGILLVLFYSASTFVQRIKAAIDNRKETGKAFMIASVLFAYCCYSVVYALHYILQVRQEADVFAVYHLASLISAILMFIGIILEKSNLSDYDDSIQQDKRTPKVVFPDWDELPLKN